MIDKLISSVAGYVFTGGLVMMPGNTGIDTEDDGS